ncbi:MAG: hypothetical protein GF401_09550, partial [Chitinivibrionales bacterium]|nr:hypothetical protein [Chitinivibrionales bacterium]
DAGLEASTDKEGKFFLGGDFFPSPSNPSRIAPGSRLTARGRQIIFTIGAPRELVQIALFDSRGRVIKRIYSGYCRQGTHELTIFDEIPDIPGSNFFLVRVNIGEFIGTFKLLHFTGKQYTISGFHTFAPLSSDTQKRTPVYKDTLVVSKYGYFEEKFIATYTNMNDSTYILTPRNKADFYAAITGFTSSCNYKSDTVLLSWNYSGSTNNTFFRVYTTTKTNSYGTPDKSTLVPVDGYGNIAASRKTAKMVLATPQEIVYYTLRPGIFTESDTLWGNVIPFANVIYPSALVTVYNDKTGQYRDRRFVELTDYTTEYTMPDYTSKSQWVNRAEYLKTHIKVTNSLYPSSPETPLNPRYYGSVEFDDFVVDRVCFESFPGFYVTGNLYRPKGKEGPFPAILCPHGHWSRGRLEKTSRVNVPARSIMFAKKGITNFSYDMIGYLDSRQLGHRFDNDQAHLWGVSAMSLHMLNSVRSLDFLLSLPDIDTTRVGCTGASGGATQTFMLSAIDDRITAAAPVNHISAHLQDGCICGNAPLMRIVTFNVEIGALFAPKPLFIVSATGDWTSNTPEVEYPAIRHIYSLFGKEDRVATVQIDYRHNYNLESRENVYAFYGKEFFDDADAGNWKESSIPSITSSQFMVFNGQSLPDNALDSVALVQAMIDSADNRILEDIAESYGKFNEFENCYRTSLEHTLLVSEPSVESLAVVNCGTWNLDSIMLEKQLLYRNLHFDYIPAVLVSSLKYQKNKKATLCLHKSGKNGLIDQQTGGFLPLVDSLIAGGELVYMIDCFNTGEHKMLEPGYSREDSVTFFTSYNRSDRAEAVQDIITALKYLSRRHDIDEVRVIGIDDAGLWAMLALSQTDLASTAVVDAVQFDNTNDFSYLYKLNIPNIRNTGGIDVAVGLTKADRLIIHNAGESFQTNRIESIAMGAGKDNIEVYEDRAAPEDILYWLAGKH